jgi:hypothetical protein
MAEVTTSGGNAVVKDGRVDPPAVGVEDVLPVRSRVSWAAVLAGSVLALSLYFVLTLFAGAVGFSIGDKVDAKTMGIGGAVFVIIATAACLFVGGFVASQFTTGENKQEGAMYGLLVWAAVFAMLVWLMASGVKAGFTAIMGMATAGTAVADVTARTTTQEDAEAMLRRAGYTQPQIEEFKEKVRNAPAEARDAADDPATRERLDRAADEARETTAKVTWWAFFGTMLSMAAAAGGGFLGAGPTFRLFALATGRTAVVQRRILTP